MLVHREIRTHYDGTISLNDKQVVDWTMDKLPMIVKDMEGKTLGLITWDQFIKHRKIKSCKTGYLINVCDFIVLPKMKPRVILRKAAA